MLLEVRCEIKRPFLVSTEILTFLSIFKKSQTSSPFEALNSMCLSRCQRDVIPYVQMRWTPTAFSRVSTGDSDTPSSCEMKEDPKFQPLQGNPAFFWVLASHGPFNLRQKTQAPYVFDFEYGIALHAVQGNGASSLGEGNVSWDFSNCGSNLGYILDLQRGWPFETPLCSANSGLLCSYDWHLRNLN